MMVERSELPKEKNLPASVDSSNGTANHLNENETNEVNPHFSEKPDPQIPEGEVQNSENNLPSEESSTQKDTLQPQPSSQEKPDNPSFLNEKLDKLSALKESQSFTDFWFY